MEHLGEFIINHWHLWLILLVIALLILVNEIISQKKKAKELLPQAAVNLINHQNAVIIDLRDKATFKKGHIIDAVNMKAEDLDASVLSTYKEKPVILVCARGLQSATIAAKIHSQSSNIMILKGGMTSWQTASLPIVKGKG